MKAWERAQVSCLCGGPHQGAVVIPVGDPMLVVTIATEKVRIRKIRCQQCAGEAPPDLPPLTERAVPKWKPMQSVAPLGRDFKVAQGGRD